MVQQPPALLFVADMVERPSRSSRKRLAASGAVAMADASSEDSSGAENGGRAGLPSSSSSTTTKKKKPWYAVQKDEKTTLEKELKRLQAQKELYEQSVPARMTALLRLKRENEVLRRAMSEQQLLLAQSKSALTGFLSALRYSEQYITERMRFLNPLLAHSEAELSVTPDGDTLFSGFQTSGNLMLREGDYESAGGDPDVATQRLVRALGSGTNVETNALLFSKFTPVRDGDDSDAESPHASSIMVIHSVDSDALHPYLPRERVRHDLHGVVALRAYPKTDARDGRVDSETEIFSFPTATPGGPNHMPLLLPRIVLPAVSCTLGRRLMQSPTESGEQNEAEQGAATPASNVARSMMVLLQRAQPTAGHKRSLSSSDEAEEEEEEEEKEGRASPGAWTPKAHAHKKTKHRKPTYLVRKEEKDLLQLQVQQLQGQVDFLRERSGVVDWQSREFQLQQKKIMNDMLRESVRNQQLSVLSAQSVVSELMASGERCPIDTPIRLGRDWPSRRETLMALKTQKLHDARRLLEKRTQFLDLSRERHEEMSFVAENGDYCCIAFESVPISGAEGVRQVYDALQCRLQNIERSASEAVGVVLTCESDDNWDKTILHRRIVHSSVRDVLTETNYVVFSEFVDDERRKGQWSRDRVAASDTGVSGGVGKEVGVVVVDYVDDDELFPYRSAQCIRHDVTGVISLRSVACKPPKSGGATGNAQDHGSVVVITKWLMLRIRHNSVLSVPNEKMQELKARINHIGTALVQAAADALVEKTRGIQQLLGFERVK
ncbi:hypothetical protein PybrP1_001805 [[Pythium] brassicae (nom. inval.)]|nr:hypothetical protein PybrP1_001805 [[Pythium] brassicae (nom. inval.)]